MHCGAHPRQARDIDQAGEGHVSLGHIQAQIRRPGDEAGIGIRVENLEEPLEALGLEAIERAKG